VKRGELRRLRLQHEISSLLWLVPLLCLLAGVALSFGTIAIDRAGDYEIVSQKVAGTPMDVQTILSTAASALVTLMSVVLSLTLVAVQLAMGQFSPRIVRALLTDRRNQLAIGLFLATFAYTMLVLREVDDQAPGGGTVPGVSVLVAYVLMLASVIALVLFVHHAGQAIRVAGLIDLVGDSTREEIDTLYPKTTSPPEANDPALVTSSNDGVVAKVHHDALVEVARSCDCALELVPAVGDFVPRGGTLFRIDGRLDKEGVAVAREAVLLQRERTHPGDPAYGIRKLVDIAERSVASSPFDDPTTAVQAIHRIHDCMRQLATREFPSGRYCDEGGKLRLVVPVLEWDGYVRLAFDEIRLVGASSPQVARRLRAAIEDVREAAPADRKPPLERQLALLSAGVERGYDDDEDVQADLVPDAQGIGSGADVLTRALNGDGKAARARDRTPAPPRSSS
jgi:uncharacterized membrane protein